VSTDVHSNIIKIANKWEEPKCPSTVECINKMWYIHVTILFSPPKNEVLIHATTQMNPENILLKEARHKRSRIV